MFIAHLPAGYLLTVRLYAHLCPQLNWRLFLCVGLFGAIAPDLDLLYGYLIDQGRVHHHRYPSHWPVSWGLLLLLASRWLHWRRSVAAMLLLIFSLNGLLHLLLDSVVGDIWWLAPWLDRPFALATVSARYQPWWLNFLLHWSFLLELLLLALAWRRLRRRPSGV
ncbi:metal-dependent hydrolase [Paludibacterium sp. THUN1379]|uniref:metal-dependent hydrolase n=1 Tax=Paludibacterium sp. THUN1379 TaxID=3112107 RepID=UPI0030918D9B|nr:metal-dependent hydrolase [Paludibacterium sp. THUN1379]